MAQKSREKRNNSSRNNLIIPSILLIISKLCFSLVFTNCIVPVSLNFYLIGNRLQKLRKGSHYFCILSMINHIFSVCTFKISVYIWNIDSFSTWPSSWHMKECMFYDYYFNDIRFFIQWLSRNVLSHIWELFAKSFSLSWTVWQRTF